MMNKQITSIFLISGSCIGAGMFALPLAFAQIGIITSIIIIVLIWWLTYYTSLISIELNLNSNNNLNLTEEFSGKKASLFEQININLLLYSLLSAYIYSCSSIMQKLIGINDNLFLIQTILTILIIILFLFKEEIISKFNNIAFIMFVFLFILMIFKILTSINLSNVQLYENFNFTKIFSISSLVFTSFGYSIIFNAIRDYCGNDSKMIKKAYFYGSIIPMIIYIIWACGSLNIIYNNNIDFYNSMINNNIEIGDFIKQLSKYINFQNLQFFIYIISILAIITSIIGAGFCLKNSFKNILKNKDIKNYNIISSLITIIPPYIISAFIPNAFVKILNFGGIFLINVSILLPIYLYFKANIEKNYIKILNKYALIFCFIIGILMIILSLIY